MPPFHIEANLFDNRESRLDHIGAGQGQPQLLRDMEPMDCERFLQSFCQAADRARIEMHQFVMQSIQCLLGGSILLERVSRIQFSGYRRFLLVG